VEFRLYCFEVGRGKKLRETKQGYIEYKAGFCFMKAYFSQQYRYLTIIVIKVIAFFRIASLRTTLNPHCITTVFALFIA
jgi:hypothetical protein